MIADQWWAEIDGRHPTVDLLTLDFDKFLNVVWSWCFDRPMMSKEDREQLIFDLNEPIDDMPTRGLPAPQQSGPDTSGFLSAMAMLGDGRAYSG